jgi:hypothetical protein
VCHGRFHGILLKEHSGTFYELPWGLYEEMSTNTLGQSGISTHKTEIKYISANILFSTSITFIYRWRALGYEKAIMAIKRHPKAITTHDEASKIPGVGSKMADKVTTVM